MSIVIDHDRTNNVLTIDAPARLASVIAKIPSTRAVRGKDRWLADANWLTLQAIGAELSSLDGFASTPAVDDLIDSYLRHEEVISLCKGLGTGGDERLYTFQHAGVACLRTGGFILGDEMGTGKTVMALQAAQTTLGINTVLVVAPKSMTHRWAREADTWASHFGPGVVIEGTKAQRIKIIDNLASAVEDGWPILAVINWEGLRTLSGMVPYGSVKKGADGPLNDIAWDLVIADEAHRAKDPAAAQTRALKRVARDARWRWALTGTPVLNTPGDMWSLLHFAVPSEVPQSRHKWHNRYIDYIDTQWGPKDTGLRRDRSPELLRLWDMVSLRRTKAEVLDLPTITRQRRDIEMATDQGRAYRKLKKDMIAKVEGGVVVATDPLALLTRLSQAASATPTIHDDGTVRLGAPSNKVTALLEILDEMGEDRQVAVFAQSRQLIDLAEQALLKAKVSYVRVTGTETGQVRDMNVAHFQDGHARVALCTLGAGSEGIDLFAADTAVFLQRSYSYGQNQQAESRIHRNGQTKPVTLIDLVSTDTVDELVIDALDTKGAMSEEVLRDRARALLRAA